MDVYTPIIIVVAIGLVAAVILTIASKLFFVPVDETFAKIRAELPGANCGACGYAGCDDYANALAEDNTVSCSMCPVGGPDLVVALAAALGVEAGSAEKEVAVVLCNGNNDNTRKLMEYEGINTCKAAKQLFGGMNACKYGCLGLGDCVVSCEFDSIDIFNGVARVNRNTCVACTACVKACPQNIITMVPEKSKVVVKCSSLDKGAVTIKACDVGCIGCGKCVKVCNFDAITIENALAVIDPIKCTNCGLCVQECPTGAINSFKPLKYRAPKKAVPKKTPEEIAELKAKIEALKKAKAEAAAKKEES